MLEMKQLKFLFLTLFFVGNILVNVCYADDITIRYNGSQAKITQTRKDSVKVIVDGAKVNIESLYQNHKLTLCLKGKSNDGQLILKTLGKAKLTLDNLNLTSQEGAPIHLKNKKKVEVVAAKGTENTLTITACNDTANHKAATLWAKDKLLFSGKGKLNIIATGNGCRGIKSKKDINIEDITLNVTTSGDNLGEKPFGPPGGFPGGLEGMPKFNPDDIPEEVKKQFEEMRKQFEGKMPNDSTRHFGPPGFPGGMPPFGGMRPEAGDNIKGDSPEFGGGFAGKHKYVASTKGITTKGKITINSGNITVRTSSAGAEGIEGKEGVVLNGGNVDVLSTDDAINAGACIEFNGAKVIARSTGNDAVDSNPQSGFFSPFGSNEQSDEPAIVIRDGAVYAWSQVGSPEEGLDCDFAALIVEGGKVFSVGGGMGEMPSVPTNETAKQPTILLIGIGIAKDEPINIYNASGKLLDTVTIPFSLRRSASLVSSPTFKIGNTYNIKTKDYERTFTLKENFTIVR